jgi:CRP-like cAMP-binding protein
VQRQLHRLFSHQIVREQRMMLLLGSMRAEERVAAFLLNLSERFTALGFLIGSLLGMKLETVSRIEVSQRRADRDRGQTRPYRQQRRLASRNRPVADERLQSSRKVRFTCC